MGFMGRVAALTTFAVAGLFVGCGDMARGPTGPDPSALPLRDVLASSVIANDRVPFELIAFVPCANGGAGEDVLVSGRLHVLVHETVSRSGNLHFKFHFQPQGATGIGLVTGDRYRATGVTQGHVNLNGPLPINDTFINNFRMIGPGRNNNLLVHQTLHITINAKGVVTSEVDNTSVECR